MATAAAQIDDKRLFAAGPGFSTGPEFAHKVKEFLKGLNSPAVLDFAKIWLDEIRGTRLPAWSDLRLYRYPCLLNNSLLLEHVASDDKYVVRFVGGDAIERAGIDPIGKSLDAIAQGEVFEKWKSTNDYCRAELAPCVVSFDLGFLDKEFHKLDTVIFPLGPESPVQTICGFYIWYS